MLGNDKLKTIKMWRQVREASQGCGGIASMQCINICCLPIEVNAR